MSKLVEDPSRLDAFFDSVDRNDRSHLDALSLDVVEWKKGDHWIPI